MGAQGYDGSARVFKCLRSKPVSPAARRASVVKTSENLDAFGIYQIVDGIGETMKQGPSKTHVDCGKGLREVGDGLDSLLQSLDELIPKPLAPALVPVSRLQNIGKGLDPETDGHRSSEFRKRSRTSDQEMKSGSGFPRRLWISFRCHSGTGTLSGVAAMASQASPRSSIRSSGGRRRISDKIAFFVMLPISGIELGLGNVSMGHGS